MEKFCGRFSLAGKEEIRSKTQATPHRKVGAILPEVI